MTSMEQLARVYGVPARRHRRVIVDGRPGRILTCNQTATWLQVQFVDAEGPEWVHPLWRVTYLDDAGEEPLLVLGSPELDSR